MFLGIHLEVQGAAVLTSGHLPLLLIHNRIAGNDVFVYAVVIAGYVVLVVVEMHRR